MAREDGTRTVQDDEQSDQCDQGECKDNRSCSDSDVERAKQAFLERGHSHSKESAHHLSELRLARSDYSGAQEIATGGQRLSRWR